MRPGLHPGQAFPKIHTNRGIEAIRAIVYALEVNDPFPRFDAAIRTDPGGVVETRKAPSPHLQRAKNATRREPWLSCYDFQLIADSS
jgi:hypothetical protein